MLPMKRALVPSLVKELNPNAAAENLHATTKRSCMLQQRFHVLQLRKGRGTRYQLVNIFWIIEKARESQKTI